MAPSSVSRKSRTAPLSTPSVNRVSRPNRFIVPPCRASPRPPPSTGYRTPPPPPLHSLHRLRTSLKPPPSTGYRGPHPQPEIAVRPVGRALRQPDIGPSHASPRPPPSTGSRALPACPRLPPPSVNPDPRPPALPDRPWRGEALNGNPNPEGFRNKRVELWVVTVLPQTLYLRRRVACKCQKGRAWEARSRRTLGSENFGVFEICVYILVRYTPTKQLKL